MTGVQTCALPICEFLVVLIQGFRHLSDCSQSYCVSSHQFCLIPHGSEDFGLEFPPKSTNLTNSVPDTGVSSRPECPPRTNRSVRPFAADFPHFRLAISFVVCCLIFGDFRRNYKLPHQTALRRHRHELQAIPLTSPPLARFKGIPCNFANPIFLLCIYPIESSFRVLPRH